MTAAESIPGGATADLIAGSRGIVVYGGGAPDRYIEALEWGLAEAQRALDLMAMRGAAVLVVEDVDANHLVWWTEPRGVVLRITRVTDINASMAVGTVRDAHGRIIPAPSVPPWAWHPSLRYFRLSQYTADLFDSYRNMYLALEAVLSDIVPQLTRPGGQVTEGEGAWLKRALTAIHPVLPLGPYGPPGTINPIEDVFTDLYKGTRTALFHAKIGRPVFMPHGSADRETVVSSLERLSRLYVDLMRQYHGIGRGSGGMTYQGFDAMPNFDADIAISVDPSPESKDDKSINPSGGKATVLAGEQNPDLSQPGLKFWLGEVEVKTKTSAVSPIRRVGLLQDGQLTAVGRLDDPLSLRGVDILQVQFGFRLVNPLMPRMRFST